MGSDKISDDELLLANFKSSVEPLTLSEQLDEWCTFYMSIGVTFDEYWYGSTWRLPYYMNAYLLKRKQTNEYLWLQGMYIYEAFSVVLARSFNGKSKAVYPSKPYEIVAKTEREKQLEIEEKQKQVIRNLSRFSAEWSKAHAENIRTDNRDTKQCEGSDDVAEQPFGSIEEISGGEE